MPDKVIGAVVMPHTEPMSSGEVARSLVRIEKSIDTMSGKLDNRPTHEDLDRVELGLAVRLDKLEDWNKWAQRLIIGAVVLALLGVVIGVGAAPVS